METYNFQINLRKKKHCHYKLPLPLSDTMVLSNILPEVNANY